MPKVQLVHVTSPMCNWSWGYEPVVNRLRMIYGKQVEFVTPMAIPYVQREKWLEDYGMTAEEAIEWTDQDVRPWLPMPMKSFRSWSELPESCLPATIAAYAAGIVHGPEAERRLNRAVLFATFVEGVDASQDKVLAEIVERLGYDNDRMTAVASKGETIDKAMEHDMHRAGHGANFFSLLVRDGQGEGATTVSLAHGYDPARAERAIDYLAGKKLAKKKPSDVLAYVEENGPVCAEEIRTAFAMSLADAKAKLARLEKSKDAVLVPTPQVKSRFYRAA